MPETDDVRLHWPVFNRPEKLLFPLCPTTSAYLWRCIFSMWRSATSSTAIVQQGKNWKSCLFRTHHHIPRRAVSPSIVKVRIFFVVLSNTEPTLRLLIFCLFISILNHKFFPDGRREEARSYYQEAYVKIFSSTSIMPLFSEISTAKFPFR